MMLKIILWMIKPINMLPHKLIIHLGLIALPVFNDKNYYGKSE
jgi:hypothetical protein